MTKMKNKYLAFASVLLSPLAAIGVSPAVAATITLDFETSAPCVFVDTTPLTNLGDVTFTGVDGVGGSILNECGGFSQTAFSGTDFYAWNTGNGTGTTVDLDFGGLISSFSIYASQDGGSGSGNSFLAEAFSIGDVLLDSIVFSPTDVAWGLMSLAASSINRVRLSFSGAGDCCVIYDDLTYTTASVPEPGTLALFALGLAGMSLVRRRRKV